LATDASAPLVVEFVDNRAAASAQRKLADVIDRSPQVADRRALSQNIHNSPYMVAQREQIDGVFGKVAQLQGGPEEEELLQGKFAPAQRQGVEDEELLQGQFSAVQRKDPDEDELPQGKFAPAQRQGMEDEELLQGNFAAVQRQSAEEEELQMKKGAGAESPAQLQPASGFHTNNTGLPENLKSGIESLSGMSMDNVNVHYNSSRPAQLNALAYAQGTDIHVASGQEQHLPHEAWHVVQQAQGRVRPTLQMKDGVAVNDDERLEHEADVMGAKALQMRRSKQVAASPSAPLVRSHAPAVQRPTEPGMQPIRQLELSENAQEYVNAELQKENLDDYDDISPNLSSGKIDKLDAIWSSLGQGKKRARKLVAARSIVKQIKTYLATFSAKALEWDKGTYTTARASMEDHCTRHPGTWEDVEEYTDAAITLRDQKWDNRFALGQVNRQRMQDASFFLITTDDKKLVTFGQR
jgi:hypothetical protein